MTLSTNVEMPSYIVYRNIQPGQPANMAAPLAFFPPLGSDELFDALRAKYPHLKTHSERVGQASLEFFYEEDLTDQLSTPQTSQSTTVSPWEPSLPSFCSEASTWSSPEAFTPSSSPQTAPLSRQQSRATNSLVASGESSPPELQAMTSVFSLANAVQPKQRIRRKMTESEKAEYRKRRIVKACDKCVKRKRKCTHNTDELHRVSASNKVQTSAKSTTAESKRGHIPETQLDHNRDQPPLQNFMEFDESSGTDPISLFDDFNTVLSDSTTDFNFDDFLAPAHSQWMDWTLLEPVSTDHAPTRCSGPGEKQCAQSQEAPLFNELDWSTDWSLSDALQTGDTLDNNATAQQAQQHQSNHEFSGRDSYVNPSLLSHRGRQQSWRDRGNDERYGENVEHFISQHESRAVTSSGLLGRERNTFDVNASDSRTNASAPSMAGGLDLGQLSSTSTSNSGGVARNVKRSLSEQLQPNVNRVKTATGFGGRHLLESDSLEQPQDSERGPTNANVGLGLKKAPGSSKGMLQQGGIKQRVSLGEGITSKIDPSTQLFMLKRRLPNVTRGVSGDSSTFGSMLRLQTIPRLQTHSEQSSPRAGVDGFGAPQLLVLHGMISANAQVHTCPSVNAPVHTRPHPAASAGSASGTPALPALSIFAVNEERLSDHVRRKDHFGRVAQLTTFAQQACNILAVVGCFLVLLACLRVPVQSLSMVLLALFAPVYDGKSTAWDDASPKRSGPSRLFQKSLERFRSGAGSMLKSIDHSQMCRGSLLGIVR